MKKLILLSLAISLFTAAGMAAGNSLQPVKFTVTMENPGNHTYHLKMELTGLTPADNLFKLPTWTPGYYWRMNYSANIYDFKVTGPRGEDVAYRKEGTNGWRIDGQVTGNLTIEYNVYAINVSVAEPFLDMGRGFICPTAMFLYPDGKLDTRIEVTIVPYSGWKSISTGLDIVYGKKNCYSANGYDTLYDSPILVGNQEVRSFEFNGIPHFVAMERPGNSDLDRFVADLKKIIKATFDLMGEIPYNHYTFIIMDRGMGGLEHSNSMAVYSREDIYRSDRPDGNRAWMNFITHEYFHLYNVKSIRPVELGPFDYDRENHTNMLWVSEGITVYYEYLIMNRAGLLSANEVLDYLSQNIRNYENIPGHLFQSATRSSYDTWINFFNHSGNSSNTTISYYDKGCALGLLLDISIRDKSNGKSSLDDVMRYLYTEYFREKKRGFTEYEFRDACEKFAGGELSEIFDRYAATTDQIDYQRYLKPAGILINSDPELIPGAWLGASVRYNASGLNVSSVERGSPAWNAGLGEMDRITMINGAVPEAGTLDSLLARSEKGDTISLEVATRYLKRNLKIIAGQKEQVSFRMTIGQELTARQDDLLRSWLVMQ